MPRDPNAGANTCLRRSRELLDRLAASRERTARFVTEARAYLADRHRERLDSLWDEAVQSESTDVAPLLPIRDPPE
jgi:hypothetical protein